MMVLFVLAAASALHAQSGELVDLRSVLESIAGASDARSVPTPEAFSARFDSVENVLRSAPAEAVRPLVSVAAGCLTSPLTVARKDCLLALAPVAMLRFDSANLLSPHLPRFEALLDDSDASIRATGLNTWFNASASATRSGRNCNAAPRRSQKVSG
jgi:hypothetical protein